MGNCIECVTLQLRRAASWSPMASSTKKELIVFDFDHTVIDANADTFINRLAPEGKIPDHIKSTYNNRDWTPYMREVFKYLHQCGVTAEDYIRCMEEIPFVPGFPELFRKLKENDNFDVIIISDANSFFIDRVLKFAGLRDVVLHIYTNPAFFDERGCLMLNEYHFQDWCSLSSRNLCKGYILDNFVASRKREGVEYTRISYAGDGSNDYCPTLRLSKRDYVFPRKAFRLLEKIKSNKEEVEATVCPFESGWDIINKLEL